MGRRRAAHLPGPGGHELLMQHHRRRVHVRPAPRQRPRRQRRDPEAHLHDQPQRGLHLQRREPGAIRRGGVDTARAPRSLASLLLHRTPGLQHPGLPRHPARSLGPVAHGAPEPVPGLQGIEPPKRVLLDVGRPARGEGDDPRLHGRSRARALLGRGEARL